MNGKFLKVGLLGACLCILATGCQHKQTTPAPEITQHTSAPVWQVGKYVDEFGEPTGFKYVYAETTGTFTNSATTNSTLAVVVSPFRGANLQGDTLGNVSFKLLENGNRWVKGKGAMHAKVKTADGTIIHTLCYNDDRGETTLHPYSNALQPDSVYKALLAGGKIMFSFTTSKAPYSSYKFTINNADGLQEAMLQAQFQQD